MSDLCEADVLVLVEGRGIAALEDVVGGQGGPAAVVDAPGVTHCLA